MDALRRPAVESKIIDFFRDHRSLWDPNDEFYYKRDIRRALLSKLSGEVKKELGVSITAAQIKDKFRNMRITFIRELKKAIKIKSESDTSMEYQSRWLHYSDMGFLKDVITSQEKSTDTLSSVEVEDERVYPSTPTIDDPQVTVELMEDSEPYEASYEFAHWDDVQCLTSPTTSGSANVETQPPAKRKKKAEETISWKLIKLATEALCRSKADAQEHFGLYVASTLRELDAKKRRAAEFEIHGILNKYSQRD